MFSNTATKETILVRFLKMVLPYRHLSKECCVHFTSCKKKGYIVYISDESYKTLERMYTNKNTMIRNLYKFCIRSTISGKRMKFKKVLHDGQCLYQFVIFHPEGPDMTLRFDPCAYSLVRQHIVNGFQRVMVYTTDMLVEANKQLSDVHTLQTAYSDQMTFNLNDIETDYSAFTIPMNLLEPTTLDTTHPHITENINCTNEPVLGNDEHCQHCEFRQKYFDLLVHCSALSEENKRLSIQQQNIREFDWFYDNLTMTEEHL
mmetsp:Transcript_6985/g.7671  ORF Transcript_6985/g.7671 Transcript_6985/m.7671 type:complete len:260 (+) Transcript_6985:165-944(+)